MIKKLPVLIGAFAILWWAFAFTPTTFAETDALKVKGSVLTLNLTAKTVTIKKSDNGTVTLKFNQGTVVNRNGKRARLKKLTLHDAVTAQYRKNFILTSFSAEGPKSRKVAGKLEDAFKGSGIVTVNGRNLQTTAQTRISRNGKLVSLSNLTRADMLVAHVGILNGEANTDPEALDLIADGPEDDEVHGIISALADNKVTITPDNGTADIVLNVTDSTMIEIDCEHANLGDLTVGMQVEADYDPVTLDAFSIEADSEAEEDDAHVSGTVLEVDAGAGTITIAPEVGDPVTLNVNASTEIEVNDVHGTLEDIQAGVKVRAEYDTATMLAKEIKAGEDDDNDEDAKVEGIVSALDAGAQTLSITPKGGGAELVLHVTPETEIEVNDEDGSLGDIQIGDAVRVEYDPVSLDAFEIKVGEENGGHGGGEDAKVEGTISGIDLDNSTVTINGITLQVTDETEIKVNGEHASITDLHVGDHARAKYDAGTLAAEKIRVGDDED